MARPKPEIMLSQDTIDGQTWQVLATAAVYILTYEGDPFNMVTLHTMNDQPRKYKKTSYANEGSARARVRELNEFFETDKFSYIRVGAVDL